MVHLTHTQNSFIDRLARIGLIAKGFVYLVLGALAFMAAFEWAGHRESEANRMGVFEWMRETGGTALLWVIAAGLICYCIWRFAEAFTTRRGHRKKWSERLKHLSSGIGYASIAFTAITLARHRPSGGDQSRQHWISEALSRPAGAIMVGVAALILAAMGLYQWYKALSGEYKKHVQGLRLHQGAGILVWTGMIGHLARGMVWLLLAFLLGRAAMSQRASDAGDTAKAFEWIERGTMGSYILGAIGFGLMAYGIFSFLRARYERF